MALARTRRSESRHELLAGFRRRAVDADPRHHLPSDRVRGGAVLSAAGSRRQGHRARAPQRADRPTHQLLSLEKTGKADLEDQLAQLRATLATAESDRDKYRASPTAPAPASRRAGQGQRLTSQLEGEKKISARALAQVEMLNQQIAALRRQLAAIEPALDASEKKNKEAQSRIADLGQRLNLALAQKVQELKSYRSDFFGKLRQILGNRPDMRIVGDRFVLQSEVLFDTGKADLKPEAPPSSTRLRARSSKSSENPGRHRLGAARRRPHRHAPDHRRRPVQVELGPVGGARHRGGEISRSARASRRSAWSPPASANSSRSTPAPPRTPTGATAASSSS